MAQEKIIFMSPLPAQSVSLMLPGHKKKDAVGVLIRLKGSPESKGLQLKLDVGCEKNYIESTYSSDSKTRAAALQAYSFSLFSRCKNHKTGFTYRWLMANGVWASLSWNQAPLDSCWLCEVGYLQRPRTN